MKNIMIPACIFGAVGWVVAATITVVGGNVSVGQQAWAESLCAVYCGLLALREAF